MDAKHETLAALWAQWNGQKGTPAQVDTIARRFTVEQLERMMAARGVTVEAA